MSNNTFTMHTLSNKYNEYNRIVIEYAFFTQIFLLNGKLH